MDWIKKPVWVVFLSCMVFGMVYTVWDAGTGLLALGGFLGSLLTGLGVAKIAAVRSAGTRQFPPDRKKDSSE
jgi:hypothetical protein